MVIASLVLLSSSLLIAWFHYWSFLTFLVRNASSLSWAFLPSVLIWNLGHKLLVNIWCLLFARQHASPEDIATNKTDPLCPQGAHNLPCLFVWKIFSFSFHLSVCNLTIGTQVKSSPLTPIKVFFSLWPPTALISRVTICLIYHPNQNTSEWKGVLLIIMLQQQMCTGQTKHIVQHNWGPPASLPDCALPGRYKSISYTLLSKKYNFDQILK